MDVVIAWKSDVDPSPEMLEYYRAQVRAYLDMTGAKLGLVVAVTAGARVRSDVAADPGRSEARATCSIDWAERDASASDGAPSRSLLVAEILRD